jgi:hypothetical protein
VDGQGKTATITRGNGHACHSESACNGLAAALGRVARSQLASVDRALPVRVRAVYLGVGRRPVDGRRPAATLSEVSAMRPAFLAHSGVRPISRGAAGQKVTICAPRASVPKLRLHHSRRPEGGSRLSFARPDGWGRPALAGESGRAAADCCAGQPSRVCRRRGSATGSLPCLRELSSYTPNQALPPAEGSVQPTRHSAGCVPSCRCN